MKSYLQYYLLAALLLAGSAVNASPVEFCIRHTGEVDIIEAKQDTYPIQLTRDLGHRYGVRVYPAEMNNNPSGSVAVNSLRVGSGAFSVKVKTLLAQHIYHFGADNFLLTDLPPPVQAG